MISDAIRRPFFNSTSTRDRSSKVQVLCKCKKRKKGRLLFFLLANMATVSKAQEIQSDNAAQSPVQLVLIVDVKLAQHRQALTVQLYLCPELGRQLHLRRVVALRERKNDCLLLKWQQKKNTEGIPTLVTFTFSLNN